MIEKVKIETKSPSKGQIVKCIKWLWSKKQVVLLTERVEKFKASISLMLEALSGHDSP
jgi:hypothetical protein